MEVSGWVGGVEVEVEEEKEEEVAATGRGPNTCHFFLSLLKTQCDSISSADDMSWF